MTGLKDRQRLALYVALGLSAGSGLMLDTSTAYASQLGIPANDDATTTPRYANGVDMGETNGNHLIVGVAGGDPANDPATPTEHPVIGKNIVGGRAADAHDNDIIINSLKAVNAGYGRIYAGLTTGTASKNHITYNGGVANALIGGASTSVAANSTHGATANVVEVHGGTIRKHVTGGLGTEHSTVNGNTVTVSGGTMESVRGGVGGNNASVTGNIVTIDGVSANIAKQVSAGVAGKDATVKENTVTVKNGTLASVRGGVGKEGAAVRENRVVIEGGTVNGRVVGSEAVLPTTVPTVDSANLSNHNTVVLGSDTGAYAAQLSNAEIWGTHYGNSGVIAGGDARIAGNTLAVNAKDVSVKKVRNFQTYQFNLTKGIDENATMLTVADANGFGNGANVQWSDIQLDAAKWNDVKNADDSNKHYGKSGTVKLIKTSDNSRHLSIHNSKAEALTRTGVSGDFEYKLATDNAAAVATAGGSVSVASVTATVNRIQNANAVYDATGRRPADTDHAVRGGYSEYGHDVTKNTLKVTNLPSTGLTAAYGGEVAGLAGEVFKNYLFVTGTDDHTVPTAVTRTLTNAYGGAIMNANNAGTVGGTEEHAGNRVAVSGGQVTNAYGGYTAGAGNVQYNTAVTEGSAVVEKSYGGDTAGAGTVQKNIAYVAGGTVADVYGGASSGNGTVTENIVALNGGRTGNAYGGYASGGATVMDNSIRVEGGTATGTLYGAQSTNGNADNNKVFVRRGLVANVTGAQSADGNVTKGQVFIAGGIVNGTVYGGRTTGSGAVENSHVTITGGTVTGTVYAGEATGSGNIKNNAVNLGDESVHDLTNANLRAADLVGGSIGVAGTGNTSDNALNVYAKNADVKSVAKFDKHRFILDRAITDGASMLTIDQGGFGREIDWNSVVVENEAAMMKDGNPGGRVTLAAGTAADDLKVAGYTKRDYTTENTEHVIELDPDTLAEAAGAGNHATAESLLLTYAKFKDNAWTYDGAVTSPASEDNEVFGGISYKGHTTENNTLVVKGVPDGGLAAAYGGKTAAGAANSKSNHVVIQGTMPQTNAAVGGIDEVYGGYTVSDYQADSEGIAIAGVAESNDAVVYDGVVDNLFGGLADGNKGKAQTNKAIVGGGTVTNVYGGVASNSDATAIGNHAVVYKGTVTNVYGGAVDSVTGAATENLAEIRGGTVTGVIAGARAAYDTAATTHKLSNKNTVRLGEANATRALPLQIADTSVYGTHYQDATTGVELTFAGDSEAIRGNTLNITTTGVSMKKVRNFDKYQFTIGNNFQDNDEMLTLSQGGGFGIVSGTAPAAPVKIDWAKVSADTSQLLAGRSEGIHGKNQMTMMQVRVPNQTPPPAYTTPKDFLFTGYTDTAGIADIDRVYEKKLSTDADAPAVGSTDIAASKVLLALNRFRDDTVTHSGAAVPSGEIYGGYSAYDHTEKDKDGHDITVGTTTESNVLNITGVANGTHDLKAFGGYSAGARGGSVNNTVNVDVTNLPNNVASGELYSVYGGYAKGANAGVVRGNTVRFSQGATLKDLMGGYIDSTNLPTGTTPPTSDVVDNHVIITGGTVGGSYPHGTSGAAVNYLGSVYGGRTDGTGDAHENTVYVNSPVVMNAATPTERDATIIVDKMVGGYGATATDNDVTILSGTVKGTVYGGYATTAGTPEVSAGVGISAVPEISAVRNNTVTIGDKAEIKGDVYGAYAAADASNMTSATDSNTINLYKAVIGGTIYGGMAQDAAGHDVVSGKNNTLAVHGYDSKAGDFAGVQNLNFYLPEDVKNDPLNDVNAPTMLKLTNVTNVDANGKKDLSNIKVGVELDARRAVLHSGDNISLMTAYNANTPVELTPDHLIKAPAEGHQDALRYKFELVTVPAADAVAVPTTTGGTAAVNNKLIAKVTEAALDPQTKSLVETRAASMAFINSGSDLLTDAAMTAAMEAAATPASESQAGRARVDGTPKEYGMWAVQNVSSMRLNSGSHVDAKGWGLNLGFAKQRVSGRNTLTYGPFVEYGKGSYDSYLDDGLHGSGDMDYLGVGVMAKSQSQNGAYVEGSVRVGRVKSDYAGTIADTHRTYDSSSTYYAGHLGVGQEKQLKNGNTIDTYAKYFFAHQGGDTVRLSNGAVYDFDAANSHRIRFGTRYTSKKGDASFYTGLAYEYEFGDDFAASYQGYNTPSPSLTGGTGILEMGYRFAPQNGRATYGIQLMGMTGQRRGISGGVQMHWAF